MHAQSRIRVQMIDPRGAAAADGSVAVGDVIIAVNETLLVQTTTQRELAAMVRQAQRPVTITFDRAECNRGAVEV